MKAKQIIYFLLSFIFIWNNLNAQKSTKVFENGSDKLIVYSDVPGLAPSEFYKIRVRSNATNTEYLKAENRNPILHYSPKNRGCIL